MKERIISKGLVFAVIILFVGVGIQPAIAKVDPENIYVEYFDVTTEFIGLDKTYTTKLTKQEIVKLDALFNSVNECLNLSKSMKESVEIFKEAVIKLDNFGLLGDIGIEETEKLMTNYYQNSKLINVFEKLNNRKNLSLSEDENLFCLISGKSTETSFWGFWKTAFIIAFAILLTTLYYDPYNVLFGFILGLVLIDFFIDAINPFCFIRLICYRQPYAYGKISTYGLNGKINWEGNLTGKGGLLGSKYGAFGFKGLKIQIITNPYSYYIGFATYVHIEDY